MNTPASVLTTSAPLARLGITDEATVVMLDATIERIERLATQVQEKGARIVDACQDPNPEVRLSRLASVGRHAGYSNTLGPNLADLMVELGQAIGIIEACNMLGRGSR